MNLVHPLQQQRYARMQKRTRRKIASARSDQAVRNTATYRAWRAAVLKRDNYTCVLCGATGVPLQADHIIAFSVRPELRFVLGNGRALCVPCHKKTPNYGAKAYWGRRAPHKTAPMTNVTCIENAPFVCISGGHAYETGKMHTGSIPPSPGTMPAAPPVGPVVSKPARPGLCFTSAGTGINRPPIRSKRRR